MLFIIYMNDVNKASSILRLLTDDTTLDSIFCDFKSRYLKIMSSLINVDLNKCSWQIHCY